MRFLLTLCFGLHATFHRRIRLRYVNQNMNATRSFMTIHRDEAVLCAFLSSDALKQTVFILVWLTQRSVQLLPIVTHTHTWTYIVTYRRSYSLCVPFDSVCSLIYRRPCLLFVLSVAFSSERTFIANSCSNWIFSVHEIYSFVRSYVFCTSYIEIPISACRRKKKSIAIQLDFCFHYRFR